MNYSSDTKKNKPLIFQNDIAVNFTDSFNEKPLTKYKEVWQLHKDFNGDNEGKTKLKPFYNEIVLLSINKYANRNAPYLSKDEFYINLGKYTFDNRLLLFIRLVVDCSKEIEK